MAKSLSKTEELIIRDLFQSEKNRNHTRHLYRLLSSPQSGFVLGQTQVKEQDKIFHFFLKSSLNQRIYMLNLAAPPLNLMTLQEKIHQINEENGPRQNIIFIYNMSACIKALGMKEEEYLARLNFIRDFFARFSMIFVFFIPAELLKLFFIHAFDFYDWFKFKVEFQPEKRPDYPYPLINIWGREDRNIENYRSMKRNESRKFIDIPISTESLSKLLNARALGRKVNP